MKRKKLSRTNSKKVLKAEKLIEKRYMWGAVDPEAVSGNGITITISEGANEKNIFVDAKTGKII